MYNFLQKYKSVIYFIVKLLIVGGAYAIISDKISSHQVLKNPQFIDAFQINILNRPWVLFAVLLFTVFNWFFEIFKWKNLVSSISIISFSEALKQSLSSLTASLLTPNRIGEYGAKAMYYSKSIRYRILFLNFWGNFSQMMITVVFGLIGCSFLWDVLNFQWSQSIIQQGWIAIGIFLISVFIFKNWIGNIYFKFIKQFKRIAARVQIKTFAYSLLRYLIFSHQFYFLLFLFGIEINYLTAMNIIFTMYFLSSLIPGFVIFDWLIKGSVALTLFGFFGINDILVLSITGLMWMLNFALPSIIGSYFVMTFSKLNVDHLNKRRVLP